MTVAVTECSYRLTVVVTECSYRLTVAVTEYSYRLTVAVTQIVTNSTTEIGTVKLLGDTKCKIICTNHGRIYGEVDVRLLSLNYKAVTSEWLTTLFARYITGQTQTGTD